MNKYEEQYFHFALCIDNLNSAWRILQEIKRQKENLLIGVAFQFALIEYSKPYKESYSSILNSKGKPIHKHKLGKEFIPREHLALHERIIRIRDEILAHTDLGIREAKVHIRKTDHGKYFGMSQNIIRGTEEMEQIDDIIDLIENTLDAMYIEAKRLESAILDDENKT